jgi:hypothetical protein
MGDLGRVPGAGQLGEPGQRGGPHRLGSIVFVRAWAQREHHTGHQHDQWTIRIGQEIMGHVPIAGPTLLRGEQTGQPLEVTARLLAASTNGAALLEVKLPAQAPLLPKSDEEARDNPSS